jgi:flagellar protein FliS
MTQRELIVMLYSGAIRYLNEAREAIKMERFDQSWPKLDRARKIVVHLYSTLNLEAGKIAEDLASLYSYVIDQICVANARREIAPIDTCISVLQTVREAWEQIPDPEQPTQSNDTRQQSIPGNETPAEHRHEAQLSLEA